MSSLFRVLCVFVVLVLVGACGSDGGTSAPESTVLFAPSPEVTALRAASDPLPDGLIECIDAPMLDVAAEKPSATDREIALDRFTTARGAGARIDVLGFETDLGVWSLLVEYRDAGTYRAVLDAWSGETPPCMELPPRGHYDERTPVGWEVVAVSGSTIEVAIDLNRGCGHKAIDERLHIVGTVRSDEIAIEATMGALPHRTFDDGCDPEPDPYVLSFKEPIGDRAVVASR